MVICIVRETDHIKKGRLAQKEWDPGEDYENEL